MAEQVRYRRPPVTEAVVEVRLAGQPLTDGEFERVRKALSAEYPARKTVTTYRVEFGSDAPSSSAELEGHDFHSKDGADIVLVRRPCSVGTSRLAPYPGWEALEDRARRNLARIRKIVGLRQVIRVGVKFVNRLDIPSHITNAVPINELVNFYPALPLGPQAVNKYSATVRLTDQESGAGVVLETATLDDHLLEHVAIALSIDVSFDKDLPTREDKLWDRISELRVVKNRIFESIIGQPVRELFGNVDQPDQS